MVRGRLILVWAVPLVAAVGLVLMPGPASAGDGLAPTADVGKGPPPASGIEDKIGAQLPLDLELTAENDQPTTLRDCIAGKPTILLPMYYRCPTLCNLVLKNLVETLREMPQDFTAGNQFNVVAFSFDPKERHEMGLAADKKKVVLQEYGRAGAENGWHFLTGSKEAVKNLMETIGYRYEFDRAYKEYNHPTGIITVTPEGKLARYFYGVDYNGEFAVPGGKTTLRLSLVEASNGKVGSLLDKLYLSCYSFDHISRRYSLNVLRAVQIGGILTLLAIGAVLAVAFRREWRSRPAESIAIGGQSEQLGTAGPSGKSETGGSA